MRQILAILWVMFSGIATAMAQTRPTTAPATQPANPFHVQHVVREGPPMRLHIATVDLTRDDLEIVVARGGDDPDGDGAWATTLMPLSSMARRDKLDLAINANFFSSKEFREIAGKKVPYFQGNWARPEGVAMSDGQPWGTPVAWGTSIGFDARNRATIFKAGPKLDPSYRQIVTGSDLIVWNARNLGRVDSPAPRTAVGLTDEGRTLVILCVDGRLTSYSAGMTLKELADEMIRLKCTQAINLDGGGSTTMVARDAQGVVQVVNRPSDGSQQIIPVSIERPIANGLGFRLRKRD